MQAATGTLTSVLITRGTSKCDTTPVDALPLFEVHIILLSIPKHPLLPSSLSLSTLAAVKQRSPKSAMEHEDTKI